MARAAGVAGVANLEGPQDGNSFAEYIAPPQRSEYSIDIRKVNTEIFVHTSEAVNASFQGCKVSLPIILSPARRIQAALDGFEAQYLSYAG